METLIEMSKCRNKYENEMKMVYQKFLFQSRRVYQIKSQLSTTSVKTNGVQYIQISMPIEYIGERMYQKFIIN